MKTLQSKSPFLGCEQQNPIYFHTLHYQETSTPPPIWLKLHAQSFLEDTALIQNLNTGSNEQDVLSRVHSCADVLACGCVGLCLLGCWQDENTQFYNSRPLASLKRKSSFSSGRRLFFSRDFHEEEDERQAVPVPNNPLPSPFSSPLPSPPARTHSLCPPKMKRLDLHTENDTSISPSVTTPDLEPGQEVRVHNIKNRPCTRAARRKISNSLKLSKNPPIPAIVASKANDLQVWDEIMDLIDKQANKGVTFRYSPAQRDLKVRRFKEKKQRSLLNLRKKKIMYQCRRDFAVKRPRVGGRFVKRDAVCKQTRKRTVQRKNRKYRKKRR